MDLREVVLPGSLSGRLYVSDMPGLASGFESDAQVIGSRGIGHVVCLVPETEQQKSSPGYFEAVQSGRVPWIPVHYPIADHSIPRELSGLLDVLDRVTAALREGGSVLVHCGNGVGRSGTFAVCVLVRLGLGPMEAAISVADAGAGAESAEQEALIDYVAAYFMKRA